jgi:hypothetical protein
MSIPENRREDGVSSLTRLNRRIFNVIDKHLSLSLQGRWLMTLVLLCVALIFLASCRSTGSTRHVAADQAAEIRYAKYNIHAQESRRDIKASYAGHVDPGAGHIIIPAGSRLEFPGARQRSRNGFWLTVADTGQRVFFEFHTGRMGMSEPEYINLITSSTPVSLAHFSAVDRKGIEAGDVYIGMTKEGVLTALGYPPRHRTSSLDANTWIYWRNRFMTMSVEFDANGKVRSGTHVLPASSVPAGLPAAQPSPAPTPAKVAPTSKPTVAPQPVSTPPATQKEEPTPELLIAPTR